MTRQVPLSEAKAQEMRAFAKSHLGISFKFGERSENMRAQISAAWDKPHILVEDGSGETAEELQEGVPPPKAKPPTVELGKGVFGKAPKIPIMISISEEAGGDEPVPVSVNGIAMLIPRGQRVEVPEPYVEALRHAIMTRYEQVDVDGHGHMQMVPREVPAYPFQVFSG